MENFSDIINMAWVATDWCVVNTSSDNTAVIFANGRQLNAKVYEQSDTLVKPKIIKYIKYI